MEFKRPDDVTQICWQMRYADYSRGRNRAFINGIFNGVPPYSEEEVEENGIVVNCNFLEGTRLGHDARSQFSNGFLKPGVFFNCKTDSGPKHKRAQFNAIVTREANRIMKRSLSYYECMRSKFALLVLHGIGPAIWENQDVWCPDPRGIEDLLIPSNINLNFKGLPFFAFLKSFKAPELIAMTRGKKVDPGWNLPLVEKAIAWIDRESMALLGTNFPEVWSPEKTQERMKSDGAYYAGDSVPTLDCYDFYYWSDQGKNAGWRRRIIIDDWSASLTGTTPTFSHNHKLDFGRGDWLYDSGSRKIADNREELFSCQFADLSAVAPFKYHSVRSLGFLMYGILQLQNRMRCKFEESVFETLTMLFRVKTMDDVQRALKLDLVNRGFIDDTINPVPASERWQVNAGLVELGLRENQQLIQDNSSSYTQNQNFSRDRVEKTRYQVMAEVNAMASMVSAALAQAYQYQTFEYFEIFRRFCRKNSSDPQVRTFQANCFRQGVPEDVLNSAAWDIEAEQIFGGGNLTRETAIAEWLMQNYEKYEPESQRIILRKATFSTTGDPGFSETIVPETPTVSDTVNAVELSFGTMLQGIPVQPMAGLNALEAAGTTIKLMGIKVQQVMAMGNGVGTPQDLIGLQLAAQYAGHYIQVLGQDKSSKQQVKLLGDAMGQIMNMAKAMAQRQQEAAQKQQQGNGAGAVPPEAQAKIAATMMTAKTKSELAKESHAAKTAQRQISFEQKLAQQQDQHKLDMAKADLEAAAEIERMRMESDAKPEKKPQSTR